MVLRFSCPTEVFLTRLITKNNCVKSPTAKRQNIKISFAILNRRLAILSELKTKTKEIRPRGLCVIVQPLRATATIWFNIPILSEATDQSYITAFASCDNCSSQINSFFVIQSLLLARNLELLIETVTWDSAVGLKAGNVNRSIKVAKR